MTDFSIGPDFVIRASMNDEWGDSLFGAVAVGRNFKGQKKYLKKGGGTVDLTGTISIQRIQGDWVNPSSSGTFYFQPV